MEGLWYYLLRLFIPVTPGQLSPSVFWRHTHLLKHQVTGNETCEQTGYLRIKIFQKHGSETLKMTLSQSLSQSIFLTKHLPHAVNSC